MGSHFKKPSKKPLVLKIVLVCAVVTALLIGCFAVVNSGVLYTIADVFNETTTTNSTGTTTSTTVTTTQPSQVVTPEPLPPPEYAVPEEMKGVWLVPGTDYLVTGKESAATVKKQIDSAFTAMEGWDFNTLLLPLHREDAALYPSAEMTSITLTDADGVRFDPVAYITEQARERQMFVYGVMDLHVREGDAWDPRVEGVIERTVRIVEEGASAYAMDGMFVSGFAYALNQIAAEERETAIAAVDALVTKVSEMLVTSDRNRYVGLMSYGIWAHSTVNEKGSKTDSYYEEFTDGCADTRGWLERGLFHCVMVKNYASTLHPTASFQKVLSWWEETANELNVPLYMSHSAKTIGSYLAGWKSPDQLAQQYLYCKDAVGWCGSAYESLTPLVKDTLGLAETLKKAYAGTINEEFIYDQLKVTQPSKLTYTTTESVITFNGGGDTNFPLTINGEAVELSEHGFFTKQYTLKIGLNTFNFEHKGKTRTYSITYKQTLVESVSPSENMTVDGGSRFVIRVIARDGSTVKAVINGVTVTLEETETKEDESGNLPSDFRAYVGNYTLPKGIVGQAQNLGAIQVTATYNGFSESKNGGSITVDALPLPPPTTTAPSAPTGPTHPGTPPAAGDSDIVIITSEYAETFNGGDFIDDWSRPYNSYLPKGTQDQWVANVYNGNLSYYLLASGKRVYKKDAKLVKGTLNANTSLSGGEAVISGMHTVLTYETNWNIPVYIAAYPQQYYREVSDPNSSQDPYYGIEKYGQTAEYVDVTFHYAIAPPAAPDLKNNPLFSKAEWIDGKNGVWTLRLTLKTKGAYYGHQLVWSGDQLSISFLNPANTSKNPPEEKLKGVSILIDPGHGSDDDKPAEGPFNLLYANDLKAKLEALGATVTMTRDKDLGKNGLSLPSRVAMAHAGSYHMVISVHMNGANGKATGATVHYYDEVGYTLSSYIYPEMREVETKYGVGTTANGTPRSSGTVWGTLFMTRSIFDCPSVLLECAFLDNPKDKEALIDPVYRDKLMQAVTDGVVAYFKAMVPYEEPTEQPTVSTTVAGTTTTATGTTEGTTAESAATGATTAATTVTTVKKETE